MAYSWYIRVYAGLNDMSGVYLVKTSWVCSVPIYTKYIHDILVYKKYTKYILGICNLYTKDNHVVYAMNILGI